MKKKTIILISCLLCIIILAVAVFIFIKKDKNSSPLTCTVDEQEATPFRFGFFIYGECVNESDEEYDYANNYLKCYNKQGDYIGDAEANTLNKKNLVKDAKWKYSAIYTGSKYKEVDHCEFDKVETTTYKK